MFKNGRLAAGMEGQVRAAGSRCLPTMHKRRFALIATYQVCCTAERFLQQAASPPPSSIVDPMQGYVHHNQIYEHRLQSLLTHYLISQLESKQLEDLRWLFWVGPVSKVISRSFHPTLCTLSWTDSSVGCRRSGVDLAA